MKIIFLDFDGVLNNVAHFSKIQKKKFDYHSVDENCVHYLNLLLDEETQVVISSTWRLGDNDDAYNKCYNALNKAEFKGKIHEDWRTISSTRFRGDEVNEWLSRHPEVTNWICLDDDSDFYPENNLIKTYVYDGLTFKNIQLAYSKLHNKNILKSKL